MNDAAEYARQIETYLCQRNRGHLVRVVGPAFELVRGWVSSGVPLKVALRGIDRSVERHNARGPQRRPIRIEYCEADVLDIFDEWRRAVGVTASSSADGSVEDTPALPRKPALAAHLERAIARLAHARGVGPASSGLQRHLDDTIRELEGLAGRAAGVRGEARAAIVTRLGELDAAMMRVAFDSTDRQRTGELAREAEAELAPFGARMPAAARALAVEAARQRLLRESLGLPTLTYEQPP